ncbi:MAG: hypothetical protein N4A65_14440 [Cohaesibacter sp.]|nr:hypothetical protein [Cohaesibacter sp.]
MDFVLTAISSNVFLNLTIFGTFAFGVFLMYRDVFHLENEIHAFESLKEEFEDTRNTEEKEAADPMWRYYRCNNLATIYKKPTILGHAHQLISEQIARHKSLSISPSTMSTLVDGIDGRLADQKSLQQYVTGILVFLGLIGTFVGLMATLASVGDILGALDLGSGDAMATVQALMDNLQKPLKGMATGFSSSLFGLVTSLTLGVMGRFASKASNDLRTNFEEWLAGVAQIDENAVAEDELETAGQAGGTNGVSARQLQLLYKVARHTMANNGRVRNQMEKLTDSVHSMVEQQREGQRTQETLLTSLSQMAQHQASMVRVLDRSSQALQSREEMVDLIAHLEDRMADRQDRLRDRLDLVGHNLSSLSLQMDRHHQALDQEAKQADALIKELDQGALDLHEQILAEHKAKAEAEAEAAKNETTEGETETLEPTPKDSDAQSGVKITLNRRETAPKDSQDPLGFDQLKDRLSAEFKEEIIDEIDLHNPSDRWDLHQLMQKREEEDEAESGNKVANSN